MSSRNLPPFKIPSKGTHADRTRFVGRMFVLYYSFSREGTARKNLRNSGIHGPSNRFEIRATKEPRCRAWQGRKELNRYHDVPPAHRTTRAGILSHGLRNLADAQQPADAAGDQPPPAGLPGTRHHHDRYGEELRLMI